MRVSEHRRYRCHIRLRHHTRGVQNLGVARQNVSITRACNDNSNYIVSRYRLKAARGATARRLSRCSILPYLGHLGNLRLVSEIVGLMDIEDGSPLASFDLEARWLAQTQ